MRLAATLFALLTPVVVHATSADTTLAVTLAATSPAASPAAISAATTPAASPAATPAATSPAAEAAAPAAAAPGKPPTSAEVARFFRAVQLDDAGTVRKMLGTTINVNQVNPVGGEPGLVQAVREGSMKVFGLLLAAPGVRLDAPAMNGNTALMMAAFQHNGAAVSALLARGAAVSPPGWTALHYAAAAGDDTIARQLLDNRAALDALSPPASVKLTPLMMAAREGHGSTVQLLLDAGADAALRDSEGLSALQIAERADKPIIAAAIKRHLDSARSISM
ncbi:MAG: ankyrin repeat domain-containing protein [Pseudomonadota bacterium]|nr:ankyrin repeat domain-containing protein [Pseudomonadota bacterium]